MARLVEEHREKPAAVKIRDGHSTSVSLPQLVTVP